MSPAAQNHLVASPFTTPTSKLLSFRQKIRTKRDSGFIVLLAGTPAVSECLWRPRVVPLDVLAEYLWRLACLAPSVLGPSVRRRRPRRLLRAGTTRSSVSVSEPAARITCVAPTGSVAVPVCRPPDLPAEAAKPRLLFQRQPAQDATTATTPEEWLRAAIATGTTEIAYP
jgi:hypothetical protein